MSSETLARITEETAEKLATASYGAETRAIGLNHMKKVGVDLAETLFAHVAGEGFSNPEINVLILKNLDGLQRSVIESFEAFGGANTSYLDSCLEAATSGFLDRGEVLFETIETRGRA